MSGLRSFLHTRWGALTAILIIAGIQVSGIFVKSELASILILVITAILLFFYAKSKGTGAAEYGLQRPKSWLRTLLLGFVYFIGAFLLLRLTLEPLIEIVTGMPRDLSRFDYLKNNLSALVKFIVMIWIAAAFFEELVYRGFFLNAIADVFKRHRGGWMAAIVISVLLFAVGHSYQSLSGIIFTGAAALYVSIIYLAHSRNLWIPIIVHGLHNSSSGVFFYFDIYQEVIHLLF
jgi:membrane protease YdiL (CAAX protease family)